MKTLLASLLLFALSVVPAPHPLEGTWFGAAETDNGVMQIALELHESAGKLSGRVRSPHGDWPVVSVAEAKETFTVTFDNGSGQGTMKGTVTGSRFSGAWDNSPMATGTFAVERKADAR
jgi:hypothetical protein